MAGRQQEPFSTDWSQIRMACSDRAALGELFERYRPILRAHLHHKMGLGEDDVDDVLQGFFADKVLERDLLAQVDRERGREPAR